MEQECGHDVALEKRLDEIRRLEGINRDLLVALEELLDHPGDHTSRARAKAFIVEAKEGN